MYTTLVHVHVKPEHLEEFIEACRLNHEMASHSRACSLPSSLSVVTESSHRQLMKY